MEFLANEEEMEDRAQMEYQDRWEIREIRVKGEREVPVDPRENQDLPVVKETKVLQDWTVTSDTPGNRVKKVKSALRERKEREG